jgi:hypothetical protein
MACFPILDRPGPSPDKPILIYHRSEHGQAPREETEKKQRRSRGALVFPSPLGAHLLFLLPAAADAPRASGRNGPLSGPCPAHEPQVLRAYTRLKNVDTTGGIRATSTTTGRGHVLCFARLQWRMIAMLIAQAATNGPRNTTKSELAIAQWLMALARYIRIIQAIWAMAVNPIRMNMRTPSLGRIAERFAQRDPTRFTPRDHPATAAGARRGRAGAGRARRHRPGRPRSGRGGGCGPCRGRR